MVKAHIGSSDGKPFYFNLDNLTRHAAIVGTTGSGKTVLGKVILEEVLMRGIPVIAIDPKGDIGGLGITDTHFDFRPFVGTGIRKAQSIASRYSATLTGQLVDTRGVQSLAKTKTTIYTPQSSIGTPLSLMPDLTPPTPMSEDPLFIAGMVDPLSASLLHLAGISGSKHDKVASYLSQIILYNWRSKQSVSIAILIRQIMDPPFAEMGSLPLADFISVAERKKLAAALNVLLTSPTKTALHHGKSIEVDALLRPSNLSVIDLRYANTLDDKQFVVETLLQKTYRYLLKRGGNEQLHAVLYIDELAGLLPPPPANPPCKKLLELLIRQARAFGLGIIVSTQSPGDVDYRIFGNMGTRFIGRLRTENDVEKVASAMDIVPSELKSKIAGLHVGEFVFNDAVSNTRLALCSRWLYSYHAGPLPQNQIQWINNPESRPSRAGQVSMIAKSSPPKKIITSSSLRKKGTQEKQTVLRKLSERLKRWSDQIELKVAQTPMQTFIPYILVNVIPQSKIGLNLEGQGPYLYNLTRKKTVDPKKVSWSTGIAHNARVMNPTKSIAGAYRAALSDSKQKLSTAYYKSTALSLQSTDRKKIENANYAHFRELMQSTLLRYEFKEKRAVEDVEEKISKIERITTLSRSRLGIEKTKRIVRRLFQNTRVSSKTRAMHAQTKQIEKWKREKERLKKKIQRIHLSFDKRREVLKEKAFKKANSCILRRKFRPKRSDLKIHTTILLVPPIEE